MFTEFFYVPRTGLSGVHSSELVKPAGLRDGAVGAGSIALLSVSQTAGPQLSPGTLVVDLGTLLLGARPQGGPLQLTLMAGSDQPS